MPVPVLSAEQLAAAAGGGSFGAAVAYLRELTARPPLPSAASLDSVREELLQTRLRLEADGAVLQEELNKSREAGEKAASEAKCLPGNDTTNDDEGIISLRARSRELHKRLATLDHTCTSSGGGNGVLVAEALRGDTEDSARQVDLLLEKYMRRIGEAEDQLRRERAWLAEHQQLEATLQSKLQKLRSGDEDTHFAPHDHSEAALRVRCARLRSERDRLRKLLFDFVAQQYGVDDDERESARKRRVERPRRVKNKDRDKPRMLSVKELLTEDVNMLLSANVAEKDPHDGRRMRSHELALLVVSSLGNLQYMGA
eukprot:jgi/Chlat1/2017/Chrsp158S02323